MSSDSSSPTSISGAISARAATFPLTRAQLVALTLTAIVAVAVTFRTSRLATYSLSDDEVTKLRAAEAYSRGALSGGYDFGVREAVSRVVTDAMQGAAIVTDVPQVVRFYLDQSARMLTCILKLRS